MNNIVIELHPDDRARLDAIISGLQYLAAAPGSAAEMLPPLQFPADHPADAPTSHLEPPAPDPVPEVKPISLGEFQKAVTVFCAKFPAKKPQVQALVHQYAESVSTIPEAQRATVLAALKEL